MTTTTKHFNKKMSNRHPYTPKVTPIEISVSYINAGGQQIKTNYEYGFHIPLEEIDLPVVIRELLREGDKDAMAIIDEIRTISENYADTLEIKLNYTLDLKEGTHIHSIINDMYLELAKEDIKTYIADTREEYHLEPSQIQSILKDVIYSMNPNLKITK